MNPLSYFLEYNRYLSFLGIALIIGLAVLMSNNRSRISWRLVLTGLMMHVALAFIVLKTAVGHDCIAYVAGLFTTLYQAADIGIRFIFGNLAEPSGSWGFIFAIKVLPVIIFFGALTSLLFYAGCK